tara:strand:+ start:514 stop:711 length:198 start_codon:yes stop_codon:yes gene_type:complete
MKKLTCIRRQWSSYGEKIKAFGLSFGYESFTYRNGEKSRHQFLIHIPFYVYRIELTKIYYNPETV